LIAGGTGFVGRALTEALLARGDRVSIGTRAVAGARLPPGALACSYDDLPRDLDAVVNLAGASIAGRRWNDAYKEELWTSRVDFTADLIARVRAQGVTPRVWVNASAVGIYGDRGEEKLSEDSPLGHGFLPDLCRAWEAAAATASALPARVVILRLGIVLARAGGALPQMALPFRFFVGGPIGRGRHYVAWIGREDLVRLFTWSLEGDATRGVYNATAPLPCTNLELSRALARALHRPCLFPVPPFVLRVVLGEVADSVRESQRVLPARALADGFTFQHTDCQSLLAREFAL
jgi:hypothetical protein